MSLDAARCALHREAESVLVCERCGRFACEACRAQNPSLCRECFDRPEGRLRASGRAWFALFAAIAAFHGLVPLAFVALWLVARERTDIGRHLAPRGSEPLLTGARWIASIALVGWSIAGLLLWQRTLD